MNMISNIVLRIVELEEDGFLDHCQSVVPENHNRFHNIVILLFTLCETTFDKTCPTIVASQNLLDLWWIIESSKSICVGLQKMFSKLRC